MPAALHSSKINTQRSPAVQVEVARRCRRQADNRLLRCRHQGAARRVGALHHQPQRQPAHRAMAVRGVSEKPDVGDKALSIEPDVQAATPSKDAHATSGPLPDSTTLLPPLRRHRWADGGCTSGNGFKLSVSLRPNTVYVFIIVGMDIAPTLRFGITRATAPVAPLAAPQGAWSNARTINGLPFTSPAFKVSCWSGQFGCIARG